MSPERRASAREVRVSDPGNTGRHEPLGGQIPALLFGTAGLSQGAGGPVAQLGESAGRGGESRRRRGLRSPASEGDECCGEK